MKNSFLMVWDLPRESASERKRVNRLLHFSGAKMLQHSLWKHRDLKKLTGIAIYIKNNGGRARILEERFIF